MSQNSVIHKGVRVELGGSTYILPPATIATLEDFSERLDALNAKLTQPAHFQYGDLGVVADFVHACLLRNYPDMQRRFVAEQVDLGNFQDIMKACYDASGLLRRSQEQEDAKQASAAAQEGGTLGESTGMASLPTS